MYRPESKSWTGIDPSLGRCCRTSSSHRGTAAKNFPIQWNRKFYRECPLSRCSAQASAPGKDSTCSNTHRSLFQSHSAGQSSLPQTSCANPRNCLSSGLSRADGRKSWLIHVAMRSLRVDVSSPRAASAPFLSYITSWACSVRCTTGRVRTCFNISSHSSMSSFVSLVCSQGRAWANVM